MWIDSITSEKFSWKFVFLLRYGPHCFVFVGFYGFRIIGLLQTSGKIYIRRGLWKIQTAQVAQKQIFVFTVHVCTCAVIINAEIIPSSPLTLLRFVFDFMACHPLLSVNVSRFLAFAIFALWSKCIKQMVLHDFDWLIDWLIDW